MEGTRRIDTWQKILEAKTFRSIFPLCYGPLTPSRGGGEWEGEEWRVYGTCHFRFRGEKNTRTRPTPTGSQQEPPSGLSMYFSVSGLVPHPQPSIFQKSYLIFQVQSFSFLMLLVQISPSQPDTVASTVGPILFNYMP